MGIGTKKLSFKYLEDLFTKKFNNFKNLAGPIKSDGMLEENFYKPLPVDEFVVDKKKPYKKEFTLTWYAAHERYQKKNQKRASANKCQKPDKDGGCIKRKRHHMMPTASGAPFNTYDPICVALGPDARKSSPFGTYVKITAGDKSVIAMVCDAKSTPGADLSKSLYYLLGLATKATVERVVPKKKRPEKHVMVVLGKSKSPSFAPAKGGAMPYNLERKDWVDFMKKVFVSGYIMARQGLFTGLVRQDVFRVYKKDEYHYEIGIGDFESAMAAEASAKKFCAYCDGAVCSGEELSMLKDFCGGISVYSGEWEKGARAPVKMAKENLREVDIAPQKVTKNTDEKAKPKAHSTKVPSADSKSKKRP